ncbi:MAG: GSCFA domain-containing protein [Hyphomicrobiaceae bacterium]
MSFHESTFKENFDNVSATIDRLSEAFPKAGIVLTVSPVALGCTWSGADVVVANMASKTTLRAVAHEICRAYDQVTYWPSFEFAMMEDVFLADGRHVKRSAVKRIISAFIEAHEAGSSILHRTWGDVLPDGKTGSSDFLSG